MICEKCKNKNWSTSKYCRFCGNGLIANEPVSFSSIIPSSPFRNLAIPLLVIFLLGAGFFGYKLYTQTQKELRKTQNELSLLRESTMEAISAQQKLLTQQSETLSKKEDELQKTKASEALLQKTLNKVQQTKVSNPISGGPSSALLNEIAPAIVKVFCLADSYSGEIQQGSGILYRATSNNPNSVPYPYYVQTNLHVVDTTDGSVSKCAIVLYPDYTSSVSYFIFKSEGYRFYRKDLDIALLTPQIVSGNARGGTLNDLATFARSEAKTPICDSANIGDHLSILGYPGIGGETLTVTDGIVSGFEFDYGTRYVKTSAKIDQGNSGGIAIKDSGCVLGIPTFVKKGSIESIGRVLDLNYLLKFTLK